MSPKGPPQVRTRVVLRGRGGRAILRDRPATPERAPAPSRGRCLLVDARTRREERRRSSVGHEPQHRDQGCTFGRSSTPTRARSRPYDLFREVREPVVFNLNSRRPHNRSANERKLRLSVWAKLVEVSGLRSTRRRVYTDSIRPLSSERLTANDTRSAARACSPVPCLGDSPRSTESMKWAISFAQGSPMSTGTMSASPCAR